MPDTHMMPGGQASVPGAVQQGSPTSPHVAPQVLLTQL